MPSNPFATDDLILLREIQAAAEMRVSAQLSAALAADQRALIFAGFLAATAAALVGAAATILTGSQTDHFLGWSALFEAAAMTAAFGFAVWSARPVSWFYPGSKPESWKGDIVAKKTELVRTQELVADYDQRIEKNESRMAASGRLLKLSTGIALITPILAVAAIAWHTTARTEPSLAGHVLCQKLNPAESPQVRYLPSSDGKRTELAFVLPVVDAKCRP